MDYLQYCLQEHIEAITSEAMDIGFYDGSCGAFPSNPESPSYMKGYNLGLIECQKRDDEFEQYLIEIGELNPEDIIPKK